ncbi:hypothetical protein [Prevotella veroralis]|uniref:Uncharacterized protein n=1 Tax=Prevotella veroralis F0319 TaxID=649761 RepID=C9MSC6_9BACT|nr:hypothetical protein [Prevotella veroralis]EEX17581.1 hypothetical protein HMPREF0973_02545 [Prevotella veroralis F0319]QUB42132.1 hypothetical protein J5A55_09665 [Prevotella veroralis]
MATKDSLYNKETPSLMGTGAFVGRNGCLKVGTDALVCPLKTGNRGSPKPFKKEGMLLGGMLYKGVAADRRGRLSLLEKPHPRPLSEWRGE